MEDNKNREYAGAQEYASPGQEYTSPLEEIHTDGKENSEETPEKSTESGQGGRLLRRFFLVGAVMLSITSAFVYFPSQPGSQDAFNITAPPQTTAPAISTLETEESAPPQTLPRETESIPAETDEITPEISETSEAVGDETGPIAVLENVSAVFSWDRYGNGAGNVIPVMKNDLWGAVDYEGNEIVPCEYPGFYLAPNDHGYFILTDKEGMNCIFSPEGELTYRTGRDVTISGSRNYILEIYEYEDEDRWEYEYRYLDASGRELFTTGLCVFASRYDTEFSAWARQRAEQYGLNIEENDQTSSGGNGDGELIGNGGSAFVSIYDVPRTGAVPYNGDTALVSDGILLYKLGENGEILSVEITPYTIQGDLYWYGGTNYYMMSGAAGFTLFDQPLSRNGSGEGGDMSYYNVANAVLKAYFGRTDSVDSDDFENSDGVLEEEAYNSSWQDFFQDGYYRYMDGSRMMCDVVHDEAVVKSVLYDAWQMQRAYDNGLIDGYNDNLENADFSACILAIYDRIWFDNTAYMAAREGDKYFFIDADGVRVSTDYEDASRFTTQGYALVVTGGEAVLINDRFESVATYGPADRVYTKGQLLVYEHGDIENLIIISPEK
ncbi:MAG: hypothetical protein HFI38_06230 [Lachnospiraceae bacterium]|jgi:hypothetical protein|nr:hypothetical protein [Lachnospiraceae bacterium]